MKKSYEEKDNASAKVDTMEEVRRLFLHSQDLLIKPHFFKDKEITIVYFESLVDRHYLDQFILPKLEEAYNESYIEKIISTFQAGDVTDQSIEELSSTLFSGYVLFFVEEKIVSIHAGNMPKRLPEESALETSIRGPKDGFVEDLNTNISLIRRRLFTPSLCVEKFKIGTRAHTEIAVNVSR